MNRRDTLSFEEFKTREYLTRDDILAAIRKTGDRAALLGMGNLLERTVVEWATDVTPVARSGDRSAVQTEEDMGGVQMTDKSGYLTPVDLTESMLLTATEIRKEIIDGRPCLVIYFTETEKGPILRDSIADAITKVHGPSRGVEEFFASEAQPNMSVRTWYWENFSEQDLRTLAVEEIGEFLRGIEGVEYADLTAGEKRLLQLICKTHANWVLHRRGMH